MMSADKSSVRDVRFLRRAVKERRKGTAVVTQTRCFGVYLHTQL